MFTMMAAPNNAEVVTAVFTALTTLVLLGSAIAALWQLRETQKTRYSELIVEMTARWASAELRRARREMSRLQAHEIEDLAKSLWGHTATPQDERLFYRLTAFPDFIEVIAAMESRGGLKLEAIDELWGGVIVAAWEKWEPAIREMRTHAHAEHVYDKFRDLTMRLREYRAEPPLPSWLDLLWPPRC